MGNNCLTNCSTPATTIAKKKSKGLPIETTFKLPAPIPTWSPGT